MEYLHTHYIPLLSHSILMQDFLVTTALPFSLVLSMMIRYHIIKNRGKRKGAQTHVIIYLRYTAHNKHYSSHIFHMRDKYSPVRWLCWGGHKIPNKQAILSISFFLSESHIISCVCIQKGLWSSGEASVFTLTRRYPEDGGYNITMITYLLLHYIYMSYYSFAQVVIATLASTSPFRCYKRIFFLYSPLILILWEPTCVFVCVYFCKLCHYNTTRVASGEHQTRVQQRRCCMWRAKNVFFNTGEVAIKACFSGGREA